jgi:hypothetical protein
VRQRQFLVIVGRLIVKVLSMLVRMKCSRCGKTFTEYPAFALPYKRFVTDQIMERSLTYLQNPTMTYQQATCELILSQANGRSPPRDPLPVFYPYQGKKTSKGLARSTVHRWITTLGSLKETLQAATSLLLDKHVDIHRQVVDVAACKYRSVERKILLQNTLKLFGTEAAYRAWFGCSIFPHLATRCLWR